ncbi:type IV pilus assembly protein FimV [Neisseria chenwenguii]|uniref:23S rRNA methyltransferase n=1 Tax=Neisseria chenwenguii TaxID=1853278 RepID=A0A220S0I7_9NEIS|nr:tetratricopeptide repeat protein [Neisseria chenwenguii]ASK26933.1 23S rRNA methyltransferase [Neisseria chenwenguii]ROV56733.1 tetratricopeptide repeat protein [Neisseria chenwenguii]
MDYTLLIILLALLLLVLLFVRYKQGGSATGKSAKATVQNHQQNHTDGQAGGADWMDKVSQSVSSAESQDWEWGGDTGGVGDSTASVSAQEVDPLTEYQVYKQFGYESKAAESLAGYLNRLNDSAPEKLVHELIGLNLRVGNIDMLAETLGRHGSVLSDESFAEYVKVGLMSETTHLGLRVLAEKRLGWNMQEVDRQIGEGGSLEENAGQGSVMTVESPQHTEPNEVKRMPIVLGKKEFEDVSPEEIGAVIGFVKPEQSAKILKDKADYGTVLQQYNRAIQNSPKPASLIIDALKLDYQNHEIGQFAGHLWKLYYSLGQYGRQVKERMLGWGYSLGYHEIFDDLEKGPTEKKVREIGLERGYIQPTSLQMKAKYRDLVQKDSSVISVNSSPAEDALKEVESLLMYGQLDQAIGVLEQAVLQYPDESQLYIMLFDLYERAEDWTRLEQFLRLLRERVVSLPEEVVLAMSRLLQRVNQNSKK